MSKTVSKSKTVPVHVTESQAASYPVMGTTTRFLLTGADTGGRFTLYRIDAEPGTTVPLHTHEHEDETFVLRQGVVEIEVGGRVLRAKPGDTVFGPRRVAHSWTAVGDEPCVFDVLTTPAGMEAMFRQLAALEPGAPMEQVFEICADAGIHFVPELRAAV